MNDVVKSTAIKYGLIVAAIGIGFMLMAYLINLEILTKWWVGIALWVVALVLFIVAVSKARAQMGGIISFKEAFATFIVAYLVNAVLTTVFSLLLFNVIDPDAAERLQDMIIESTAQTMENFGAPEESIDETISQMSEASQFGVGQQIRGFFTGIIIYSVIGLIVAAVMKKKRPEYEG